MQGLATGLALCLGVTLASCGPPPGEVPDLLLGRWSTETPAYKGRYFEINRDRLLFETSEAGLQVHRIQGAESDLTETGLPRHVLHYAEADGEPATLRLIVQPGAATTLRIENTDELWRRAPEPQMGIDMR
jgi:hypothetical protein